MGSDGRLDEDGTGKVAAWGVSLLLWTVQSKRHGRGIELVRYVTYDCRLSVSVSILSCTYTRARFHRCKRAIGNFVYRAFDRNLRLRDPSWGVRDLEKVQQLALECGLEFVKSIAMPANNLSLLFRKQES